MKYYPFRAHFYCHKAGIHINHKEEWTVFKVENTLKIGNYFPSKAQFSACFPKDYFGPVTFKKSHVLKSASNRQLVKHFKLLSRSIKGRRYMYFNTLQTPIVIVLELQKKRMWKAAVTRSKNSTPLVKLTLRIKKLQISVNLHVTCTNSYDWNYFAVHI